LASIRDKIRVQRGKSRFNSGRRSHTDFSSGQWISAGAQHA
jgi:hypothetical protein